MNVFICFINSINGNVLKKNSRLHFTDFRKMILGLPSNLQGNFYPS